MPNHALAAALAGAALAAALAPARADAPGDVSRPGHASAAEHPSRSRHHVWGGGAPRRAALRAGAAAGFAPAAAAPLPDGPAPPDGRAQAVFAEFREPYLPHGVVYNVPPEPAFPPARALIRVRY